MVPSILVINHPLSCGKLVSVFIFTPTHTGASNEPQRQFSFPLFCNATYCLFVPWILSTKTRNETDIKYRQCLRSHLQLQTQANSYTYLQYYLYLYDLASRLAEVCLLGEEEEGRRWVVEYPGVSEDVPKRWSLLGDPDPDPPPADSGELTRCDGKVELE